MRIETYQSKYTEGLIEFWNRNLGATFPMTRQLWDQNLRSDFGFLPNQSWMCLADGELVGVILNKYLPIQMGTADLRPVGWVNTLLVDREYRSQGLGSALYERTEKLFREEGLQRIALGAELGHFFPGIPKESVEAQTFFLNRGYTGGGEVCDLNCTRDRFLAPAGHELSPEVAQDVKIGLAEGDEDLRDAKGFFQKYFPGRWEHEFSWAKEHGLLDGLVLLRVCGVVKGFARIYDAQSKFIGPSIYWAGLMQKPYGGLGPIGVAGDERGKGLGMELLYRSLMMLWDRGVEEMAIDFTTLVDFYGKLGFEPWKWYLRYVKNLVG